MISTAHLIFGIHLSTTSIFCIPIYDEKKIMWSTWRLLARSTLALADREIHDLSIYQKQVDENKTVHSHSLSSNVRYYTATSIRNFQLEKSRIARYSFRPPSRLIACRENHTDDFFSNCSRICVRKKRFHDTVLEETQTTEEQINIRYVKIHWRYVVEKNVFSTCTLAP